jgi:hypothetical protein
MDIYDAQVSGSRTLLHSGHQTASITIDPGDGQPHPDSNFADYVYGTRIWTAVITTNVPSTEPITDPRHTRTTIADVYVPPTPKTHRLPNYHETKSGSAYIFDNYDRENRLCNGLSTGGMCRY